MKNILVTGGAGYIGSFMVKRLLDEGFAVSVLDSLERGHKEAVDRRASFYIGNLLDKYFLQDIFSIGKFDAVIHFAGLISVGESMKNPDEYFRNNTFGTFFLIEKMREYKVENIIFSSTAGVYGNPKSIPISEDDFKMPESPYGESKLLAENGIDWYSKVFGINSVCLRYFNAAGASIDGKWGENHLEETHIIPNIINSVLDKRKFTLFGNDYKTKDGTCVRDYIHVLDLIEAHLLALKKLESEKGTFVYNVGTGKGFSNKEVVTKVEEIANVRIELEVKPKRPGDADILIADNSRIKKELGFIPKFSDLETIISSAWRWHSNSINKVRA